MPTEPYEPMLNRDWGNTPFKKIIDTASSSLEEAVNYATNLYQKCQASNKGSTDEAFPIIALYLHIIQLTDAIQVLVSAGCVEPANLLLRSIFEAKLSMEYMVETDTNTRATAWGVKNIVNAIELGRASNRSASKGGPFGQMQDPVANQIKNLLPPFPVVSEEYFAKLRTSLQKPGYVDVYREYQRLTNNHRRVEWYSLYDGPRNVKALAEHLKQGYYYHLYQSWSKMSHAADSNHLTLSLEDGTSVLGPIRNPLNTANVACSVLGMVLEASKVMIKEYRSGDYKSLTKWWDKEIRTKGEALFTMQLGQLRWYDEKFPKDRT